MKNRDVLINICKQICDKGLVICPDCKDQENLDQPLMVMGDYEETLFCPHCELEIITNINYRHS